MRTVKFGKTDLDITPIGFGAWAIGGGDWDFAWGDQDDNASVAAIQKALDLGINWIDTAAIYGLGHSEEIVAKAVKGRSEKPLIFTKCSLVWDKNRKVSNSLKADSVRREVEASLKRLQVETIDLYQIHWPNPEPDIEEGWRTLAALKQEGKVRHIGVSNFNVEQMERVSKITPVETLQPPFSLINHQADQEILPYCEQNNIGVIVYSPMASGLLSGTMTAERVKNMPENDWRRKSREFNEPRLSRNLKLVDLLREIGREHDRSPGEVAIAWTLANPGVSAAIVGARSPEQVEGFVGASDLHLSHHDLDRIQQQLK